MNISEYLTNKFKYKLCHVIGFGRSNRPLVELLISCGAGVTVHDKNTGIADEEIFNKLTSSGVKFVLGEDYLSRLGGDYIFRSPGIRHDLPEISGAVKRGAVLTSEMELFFEVCPCRIIGITGSDGKTTTTTLTHLFLETEFNRTGKGRAYVGGNIGQPLLPLVSGMTENDVAIVELSSFQLQTMKTSPKIATITNITPNHLNWHVDMDEYITAKCNICRHGKMERLVVNAENDVTREIAKNSDQPLIYFSSKKSDHASIVPFFKENCLAVYEDNGEIFIDDGNKREKIIEVSDIIIPGRHNVENYMTAIALTHGLVSKDTVRKIAQSFKGVEHRLEFVRERDGVRFYNSSIDSSPSRTAAAVSALPKAPVIICGGAEKGVPFDSLAEMLCTSVKGVVLTGDSAPKIMAEIEKCPKYDVSRLRVEHKDGFEDAVLCAASMAEPGDIVLLSPACTSFDRFKNFEERGKYFKDIVNSIE